MTEESDLNRFLNRLLRHSPLSPSERKAILGLPGLRRRFAAKTDIVSPGQMTDAACLIVEGLAARFDQMRDGHRQTTALHIPGDMCDLHSAVQPKASWSITALNDVEVLRLPHAPLLEVAQNHPAIAVAFWRDSTADASILAKWVGNLGRKDATARVAHIFCEMGLRFEAAGIAVSTSYFLGMSQLQLADAAGLTPVHVNRVLQSLRARKLLSYRNGYVEIEDFIALAAIAEFDPDYLLVVERI